MNKVNVSKRSIIYYSPYNLFNWSLFIPTMKEGCQFIEKILVLLICLSVEGGIVRKLISFLYDIKSWSESNNSLFDYFVNGGWLVSEFSIIHDLFFSYRREQFLMLLVMRVFYSMSPPLFYSTWFYRLLNPMIILDLNRFQGGTVIISARLCAVLAPPIAPNWVPYPENTAVLSVSFRYILRK